jgi:hypothetical protein
VIDGGLQNQQDARGFLCESEVAAPVFPWKPTTKSVPPRVAQGVARTRSRTARLALIAKRPSLGRDSY